MKQQTTIQTSDGLLLDGLFERPESVSSSCVILCHGLTFDKEENGVFTKLAAKIADEGFHTFRFDFRGCGQSDGDSIDFTISGSLTDLESVVTHLKFLGYDSFIILAASFSGGCTSFYSSGNPIELKGLILWNALIDYEEKINPTTEWNKKAWGKAVLDSVEKHGYIERSSGFRLGKKLIDEIYTLKPWQALLKYDGPVIFIHGTADPLVPYSYSKKYADEMDNAQLVSIEDAGHGFHNNENHYKQAELAVIEFIKQTL